VNNPKTHIQTVRRATQAWTKFHHDLVTKLRWSKTRESQGVIRVRYLSEFQGTTTLQRLIPRSWKLTVTFQNWLKCILLLKGLKFQALKIRLQPVLPRSMILTTLRKTSSILTSTTSWTESQKKITSLCQSSRDLRAQTTTQSINRDKLQLRANERVSTLKLQSLLCREQSLANSLRDQRAQI
jgi:saccharopine dehydrogenase-like NADP-dependent oxidoreductase